MSGTACAALPLSMVPSLGVMEGYAEHIADALITGAEAEDKEGEGTGGPLVFIRLFTAFALLNLAFRRARYPGGTFLRVSRLYPRSPLPSPHQQ
jgi:hypothetical protein